MGFTGERSIYVCFISPDLDLMERFYPKLNLGKTVSVQKKNTTEESRKSPWKSQRKMHLNAQILLNFCKICVLHDFEAAELVPKSPTTVK